VHYASVLKSPILDASVDARADPCLSAVRPQVKPSSWLPYPQLCTQS